MSTIVGIDLGTSNTSVAHVDKKGRARVLVDEHGASLIPSVVSFDGSGKVFVGAAAQGMRFRDPKNTIFGAKRLMGRAWSDPELQEARQRLPYELRQGKNETVRVLLHGELYTLPEISAFILRKAKAVAEAALGEPVTRAVVTVPANFNELQREATKLAGTLADLEVVRVLNEPTAAALAYGWRSRASEQIIVYDFGGGTFDVTLLSLSKTAFRVRATAGDMFLGGDDVDVAIADRIAEAFLKKHHYDPKMHGEVFDKLREAGERLKVQLSTDDRASVELDSLLRSAGGKEIKFGFAMTRAELEAIAEPIVRRTLAVCETALGRVRASPKDCDRVVMVGGSTRLPLVRQRVAEFFGREPVAGVNPDEAVALGAAIHALALADAPTRSKRAPAPARPGDLTDDELIRELMEISARASAAAPPPLVASPDAAAPPLPRRGAPAPAPSRSRSRSGAVVAVVFVLAAIAAWIWVLRSP